MEILKLFLGLLDPKEGRLELHPGDALLVVPNASSIAFLFHQDIRSKEFWDNSEEIIHVGDKSGNFSCLTRLGSTLALKINKIKIKPKT